MSAYCSGASQANSKETVRLYVSDSTVLAQISEAKKPWQCGVMAVLINSASQQGDIGSSSLVTSSGVLIARCIMWSKYTLKRALKA